MKRRSFLALTGAALAARPAIAAPERFALDVANSTVVFTYRLNGNKVNGRIPVSSADITLDRRNLAASRVAAVIDAARADAGPFYATQAMNSQAVLDIANFPTMSFESKNISGRISKAKITGALTIRDVTRDITLDAAAYKQRGTDDDGVNKMSILMTGNVDRRDFGASGFPQFVAPMIRFQILTRITRA